MSNECFFCLETTDERATNEREGNVSMRCCHQVVHSGCLDRWMADYDYCGYCRTSTRALEPLADTALRRLWLHNDLLSRSPYYRPVEMTVIATVVGAGLLVDDKEIISELQKDLTGFNYVIDRKGPNRSGFQAGRLVHVTFKSPTTKFSCPIDETPNE